MNPPTYPLYCVTLFMNGSLRHYIQRFSETNFRKMQWNHFVISRSFVTIIKRGVTDCLKSGDSIYQFSRLFLCISSSFFLDNCCICLNFSHLPTVFHLHLLYLPTFTRNFLAISWQHLPESVYTRFKDSLWNIEKNKQQEK